MGMEMEMEMEREMEMEMEMKMELEMEMEEVREVGAGCAESGSAGSIGYGLFGICCSQPAEEHRCASMYGAFRESV